MAETHPLYHQILDHLLERDRREFLPEKSKRLDVWLQFLGDEESDTDIVDLGSTQNGSEDVSAARLFDLDRGKS
ncbi:hypothetical protein [Acanthopleuribacter pedis]|uniref:Uncharacterized protein n=1 Tax=Acanthopleuribacter pedis TaxID=442870 RepID=A0A8J7U0Z9_9BACT|nr:hypothetical protein [Acanthopleuribacter pedis]MBO1317027.1 hypothetical protein [Acanthopleuribacter pedis]